MISRLANVIIKR